MDNRPTSRESNVSSDHGYSVDRRGDGLNLGGPVGNSGGYQGRPGLFERTKSRISLILIIVLFFFAIATKGDMSGVIARVTGHIEDWQNGGDKGEILSEMYGDLKGDAQSFKTNISEAWQERILPSLSAESREEVASFSGPVSGGEGTMSSLSTGLKWTKNGKGNRVLKLSEEEWAQIDTIKLNVFYDDGDGYIDLGLDPLFTFDEDGNLIGEYDGTWIAIDRQPVAFYHLTTIDKGDRYRILGYVPAFLNDQHVNLILVFDNDHPKGYIAGAKVIKNGPGTDLTTEQMVSDLIDVKAGDTLDFVCDYYEYNGTFINNYFFGKRMTLSKDPKIQNVKVNGSLSACYMLTDKEGNRYWTPLMD